MKRSLLERFFVGSGLSSSLNEILAQAEALRQSGESAPALALLDEARKKYTDPRIWQAMAALFSSLNMPAGEEQVLREGLKNYPGDAALSLALANYYYRADRSQEGLSVLGPLMEKENAATELRLTYASLLKAVGENEKARGQFEAVLVKEPHNAAALSNLAGMELDACNCEKAARLYEQAFAHDKTNSHIASQLALVYFRMGHLEKAWRAYEARFGLSPDDPHATAKRRPFPQPLWQGEKLSPGQTLLLYGEQGIGEETLHASMLADAASRAATLYVECDPRLAPLLQRSFPAITFIARSDPSDARLGKASHQAPLGHLGYLFRKRFEDFPKAASYLKADAEKTAVLRAKYQALKPGGKIIGISWKSKKLRHGDPKSTALSDWVMIFGDGKNLFVSLQYGVMKEELDQATQLYVDPTIDQHKSLDDFAAQVAAMDGVITVSNTAAHMAGALGIKTTVLLPASRGLMGHWFDGRTDSPWYSSLTLLRQTQDGLWDDVMRRARDFLKAL